MGVRTRCSTFVGCLSVARYLEITRDSAILNAEVPFVEGPELDRNEHERMFEAVVSTRGPAGSIASLP